MGLLFYLHLFLYAILAILVLVVVAYFQIRADVIRAKREEKRQIRIENARRKVREKYEGKVKD